MEAASVKPLYMNVQHAYHLWGNPTGTWALARLVATGEFPRTPKTSAKEDLRLYRKRVRELRFQRATLDSNEVDRYTHAYRSAVEVFNKDRKRVYNWKLDNAQNGNTTPHQSCGSRVDDA
jgi:hypothetical protein